MVEQSVPPSQATSDPWQPVGSVLEQLFQMLDFVPTAGTEDPRWRPWHCRPGDLVEVCGASGVIGRYFVTHACPRYLKIEGGRCFAQHGWPIVSGKKSPIRAEGEAMSAPIEVLEVRPVNAGNLKAFAKVKLGCVVIHGCRVVQQDGQRPWGCDATDTCSPESGWFRLRLVPGDRDHQP
jgi:hypothetical protein